MPHYNLNDPKSAKDIQKLLEQRTADLVKMAGMEFFAQVIKATPVATGRARWGWYVTQNKPSTKVPPPGKYPMPTIETHMEVGTVTVNDKVLITNRVPYIKKLNKGYSKQAPARFVELAAERVQAAINKLWKKIK